MGRELDRRASLVLPQVQSRNSAIAAWTTAADSAVICG